MTRFAAAGLAMLISCSGGSPTETPSPAGDEARAAVSLRNAMAEPLAYIAAGEGALALINVTPTLAPGSYDGRLVPPGETREVIDIIGYDRRLGVNFWLYRVNPATGVARFARPLSVSAAELVRTGGVVSVDLDRF